METSPECPSLCYRTIVWSVVSNQQTRTRQWRWPYPRVSCLGYDPAHPRLPREHESTAEWEKTSWTTEIHWSQSHQVCQGEFPEAGKALFGSKFAKEIVGHVEADTAICKASAIVNKGIRSTSSKGKSSSSSKPDFFRWGQTGGHGTASGRNNFSTCNKSGTFWGRGRGKYNLQQSSSVFNRLGPNPITTDQQAKQK